MGKSHLEAEFVRRIIADEHKLAILLRQGAKQVPDKFKGFMGRPVANYLKRNWQFDPYTKREFDFVWPIHKLALEIQGGIFGERRKSRQGHASVDGLTRDYRKLADAQLAGWRLLWLTPEDVNVNWHSWTLPTIAMHLLQLQGST